MYVCFTTILWCWTTTFSRFKDFNYSVIFMFGNLNYVENFNLKIYYSLKFVQKISTKTLVNGIDILYK